MEIESSDLSDTMVWNACILALCGWCKPDDCDARNLSCSICNRQVSRTDKPFNPISEHRFYCPWAQVESPTITPTAHPSSSSSADSKHNTILDSHIPGWEMTLNSLLSLSTKFQALKRQSLDPNVATSGHYDAEDSSLSPEEVFKKVKSLLDSTIVGVRRPLPLPDPNVANIHSAISGSIPPNSYNNINMSDENE